jgi:hypothetical protein
VELSDTNIIRAVCKIVLIIPVAFAFFWRPSP